MDFETLKSIVSKYSKIHILEMSHFKFLISEKGGRILSIDSGSGNILWSNPNIESEFIAGDWNLGGIRIWLAPERALFYKNPSTFEGWFCQAGLDPGKYKILSVDNNSVSLKSDVSAINMISKKRILGKIRKHIKILSEEKTESNTNCSFSITTDLEIKSTDIPLAIWCLVQVPTQNYPNTFVVIPNLKKQNPIPYFTDIPKNYLYQDINSMKFIFDGKKELKLAINPEDLQNPKNHVVIFNSQLGEKSVKIRMSSSTGPVNQKQCIDPAKKFPSGLKGSIQFYNSDVNRSGLRFGELELQSKPIKLFEGVYRTNHKVEFEINIQ